MFKPIVNITKVSKQSDYFELVDATTNYPGNQTGWTVPNGPTNNTAITNIVILTQFLGTEPVQQLSLTGDIFSTGLKVTQSLLDGVYAINPLYGMPLGLAAIAGAGTTTITTNLSGGVFTGLLDGITHIAATNDPNRIYKIKSLDSNNGKIELYEVYNGTGAITSYFGTTVFMMLITNCGENIILHKIADFSLINDGCNTDAAKEVMELMILKQSAAIAFSCKEYAKAHKAASLLCLNNSLETPCTHC